MADTGMGVMGLADMAGVDMVIPFTIHTIIIITQQ